MRMRLVMKILLRNRRRTLLTTESLAMSLAGASVAQALRFVG